MSKLPIALGWKPTGQPIRIDLLPPLSGECAVHVHETEGTDKAHVKFEYGDTPYCLSIFVFDLNAFLNNRPVKVRSYDLWDKEIMYAARLPSGKPHPRNPGWFYREDAVIIDWGSFSLKNGLLEIDLEVRKIKLKYRVKFTGIRRYRSPKYGFSIRSEYLFEPL